MLFASTAAPAAEITVIPDGETSLITIEGRVADGDELVFKRIAAKHKYATVLLYSEGGSTLAAIEIGRAIRLRGFATAVVNGFDCTSSCGLIWLAGSPRYLARSARVGFHAVYTDKTGARLESGVGNAIVGRYLTQLNLPEQAVMFATVADPNSIMWLTADNAAKIGIEIAVAPDMTPDEKAGAATEAPASGGEAAKPPDDEKPFSTAGAWQIRNGGRRLGGGCYARAVFDDIYLMVGFDLSQRVVFVDMGTEAFKDLKVGDAYDMQIQFDAHKPWSSTGRIAEGSIKYLMMNFAGAGFLTEFMTSKAMVLREPGKSKPENDIRLLLVGSGAAGREILRCQGGTNPLAK
jgi:hypothetical protein